MKGALLRWAFSLAFASRRRGVICRAKLRVLSGADLDVLKDLPPPCGRPKKKNAGVRRKEWYEHRPANAKKRSYACFLCHEQDHIAKDCALRQVFSVDPWVTVTLVSVRWLVCHFSRIFVTSRTPCFMSLSPLLYAVPIKATLSSLLLVPVALVLGWKSGSPHDYSTFFEVTSRPLRFCKVSFPGL